MTAEALFRDMMRERRQYLRGTAEHDWRTRAARHYAWLMRGLPVTEWIEI